MQTAQAHQRGAQMQTLRARSVSDRLEALADVDNPNWRRASCVRLDLVPTPLERQPSAYVRESWRARRRGEIPAVIVSSLVCRRGVAVSLRWPAGNPVEGVTDWNVYPDACAVLFPADGVRAPLETMGSVTHPVRGWYWRAGWEHACEFDAHGLGTVERHDTGRLLVAARHRDGEWIAVLVSPFDADGGPLVRGGVVPVGFAVWSGSVGERAGLKSFTPTWHRLETGVKSAGRSR